MSIREIVEKIKDLAFALSFNRDAAAVLLIILTGFASFGLGRLSATEEKKMPVQIIYPEELMAAVASQEMGTGESNSEIISAQNGAFVASRNSDKYHFPWCSGALRIAEENKIWFSSQEEAEQAGYIPAANCRGLKK